MRPTSALAIVLLGVAAPAAAQEAPPADAGEVPPEAAEPAPEVAAPVDAPRGDPPAVPVEAAAPPVTAPAPQPITNLAVFERLPPDAYPEPVIRGLPQGSLWMTFHGMQWPYYPKTGIGVSGSVWIDSGYERIERRNPAEQSIDYWLQQGRLVLRATPTYTKGDFFVQGQAELVANKDQAQRQPDIADTDDLWIKAGVWNKWDVQLGRYEGWEVYHFGMGLDLYTLERNGASSETFSVPGIYGLTYAYYRPAGVGQAAAHYYPTDNLRFELGTQFGNEFGSNALATRPVAVLDYGFIKVKAGAEYKLLSDQKEGAKGETESRGIGGAVQVVWLPWLEAGINGAVGLVDRYGSDGVYDDKGSNTTYSIGGFANGRVIDNLLVGVGLNYTYLEDLHMDPALDRVQKFNHVQSFAAVQYLLFNQLYVKAVVAYANADYAPNFGAPVFENDMVSGRIRVMYAF